MDDLQAKALNEAAIEWASVLESDNRAKGSALA